MIDTSRAVASLQREFPAPRIDPAWIQACAQALSDDGQETSLANIREQYLFSDLSASTLPSGLIPAEPHDVYLFPSPTLVQLLSITEIGYSAFQLQTVQEQRKDVLSGVTRIRRMDDEEADENGEGGMVDDGRLPSYPRGMLKMEVTDGERSMKAMEYKRLAGLTLAETPLGAKLVLHKVRALRGTLLLSPENTKFLGYEVSHLEADQPTQFTNSLLRRMDKPIPGEDEDAPAPPDPPPHRRAPAPSAPRPAPARAAPPAPAPARRLTIPQSSSTAAGPSRPRAPPPAAVPSPYFQSRPTQNATASSSSRPAPPAASRRVIQIAEDDEEYDEVFDDSFIRQLDAAEARATSASAPVGRGRTQQQAQDQSSDYGLDDIDEAILGELEQVERQQQQRMSGLSGAARRNGTGTVAGAQRRGAQVVDDEEEEEKVYRSSSTVRSARAAGAASRPAAGRTGSARTKRKAEDEGRGEWPDIIEISD